MYCYLSPHSVTPEDHLLDAILKALSKMSPAEAQAEAIRLINLQMPHLSSPNLRSIQEQIRTEMDASMPLVSTVLDMLEGHLALREMGFVPEGDQV